MRLVTSQESVQLTNPDNVSQAWQWVGLTREFTQPVTLQSIQLLIQEGTPSGVAYFDDVCVSVTLVEETVDERVVVGGAVGGVLLLLLILVAVAGGVLCCTCSR